MIPKRGRDAYYALSKLLKSTKIRIGEWKKIKIPPQTGPKYLQNNYIPFSKRFLFREIISDSSLSLMVSKETFEKIAIFIDEKINNQYRLTSEEFSLLLKPLLANDPSPMSQKNAGSEDEGSAQLNRKQLLDNEYWFLRRLSEIAPTGGFMETSLEALQESCLPRSARGAFVKTYVEPADYDVLRVWTRGLHPSRMYSIDRSLIHPPKELAALQGVQKWLTKLTSLIAPKARAIFSTEQLCYGHVLLAFRRKEDDRLRLRMLKHVPVSAGAKSNLYAEGVVDLLPEHRFIGLSKLSNVAILASAMTAAISVFVITPCAFVMHSNPELVFAWSLAVASAATTSAVAIWLRYWKLRADWSERLRHLTLACDFNTGAFTVAHVLAISQAELLKSALIVYFLLLPSAKSGIPLNKSQLEIRAESWVASRLSPRTHVSLPTSSSLASSPDHNLSHFAKDFNGGSGPLFDLAFDARPALTLLRHLNLVRGSDERLEAVLPEAHLLEDSGLRVAAARAWSFLSPEIEENFLGLPHISIKE